MLKYLNLFEKRHKGVVTNLFLGSIREGILDNEKIIQSTKEFLEQQKHPREWINGYTGRLLNVPLKPHYKIVEDNLDNPDLIPFLEYYKEYSTLNHDQQKIVKKRKVAQKRRLKEFFHQQRPLSWSAISSFRYNPQQFVDKYVLNKKQDSNAAMDFGKEIGEKLAKDPTFLPDVLRYKVFEKRLTGHVGVIPIIGYLDSFDPETKSFYEYKTSSNKKKWHQKSAEEHGQLLFYKLLIWMNYRVPPEKLDCKLFYIPCDTTGDFKVELSKEQIQSFDVKHTSVDLLKFGKYIKDTYKEMEEFINS
jgi:hypothetical protein